LPAGICTNVPVVRYALVDRARRWLTFGLQLLSFILVRVLPPPKKKKKNDGVLLTLYVCQSVSENVISDAPPFDRLRSVVYSSSPSPLPCRQDRLRSPKRFSRAVVELLAAAAALPIGQLSTHDRAPTERAPNAQSCGQKRSSPEIDR
jgi:hypothetical protein